MSYLFFYYTIRFNFFLFLDNHDEARIYVARQRHMMPPVYNNARLNERPLPNVNQPQLRNLQENGRNDLEDIDRNIIDINENPASANANITAGNISTANEPIILENNDYADGNNGNDIEHVSVEYDGNGDIENTAAMNETISSENDVHVDGDNSNGIHEILVDEFVSNENHVKEEDPLDILNDFSDEEDEINASGVLVNFKVIDEDLVMFFKDDDSFKPRKDTLQVKRHDGLSGSLPFKEYVSFFILNIT